MRDHPAIPTRAATRLIEQLERVTRQPVPVVERPPVNPVPQWQQPTEPTPVTTTPPVPDWVHTRQPQPFAPYPGNTPVDYPTQILADNQRVLEAYQQQQARHPVVAQWPNPIQIIDRLIFPPAYAENVYGQPFPIGSSPLMHTTEQLPVSDKELHDFRELAERLKEEETIHRQNPNKGLDSVDALQVLMSYAARLTDNDAKRFVLLLSEVLLGKETNNRTPNTPSRSLNRIIFGDLGMNPIYQDHSEMQMYHFWAYVHYGFFYSKDTAKLINHVHERVEPKLRAILDSTEKKTGYKIPGSGSISQTGTKADFLLSGVGYNVGQALAKGDVTPTQLSKQIDRILRSNAYRPFTDEQIPNDIR